MTLVLTLPASASAGDQDAPLSQLPKPQPGEYLLVAQRVPVGDPAAAPELNGAVAASQALTDASAWTRPVAKAAAGSDAPCHGDASASAPMPLANAQPSQPLETRVFMMKADPGKAAKKPSPIAWPEGSHTANWGDAAIIFASGAVAAGVTFGVKPAQHDWGTNPVDTAATKALGVRDPHTRGTIDTLANIGFYGALGLPIVETLAMLPRDSKTAWNYFVMSAEAMSLLGATAITAEHVSGRARPYVQYCGVDPSFNGDCNTADNPLAARSGNYQSFFSGHTAMTTVSATLSCLEHYRMGLFQNKAVDITHCAVMEGIAVADGLFRVMGYRHNLTDVAIGWGSGVGTAFLIDYLWHGPFRGYAQNREDQRKKMNIRVAPEVTSTSAGLMVMGTW